MEQDTGIAEVVRVTKHPVVEIAEGIEVGGCTVQARIYAPADKYSHELFLVKISKPSELTSFQHEKGLQMEHGEFHFDCGEELKVGDRLEILIFPAATEDPL
jgi:hypothetical protein